MELTLIDLIDADGFTRTVWMRGSDLTGRASRRLCNFADQRKLQVAAISIYPGADFARCLDYANAYGCGSVRKDR